MLQIIYQGEAIDLAPGQTLELERNSPMFMLDDIFGEKSDPITIAYSERNARFFRQIFNDKASKRKLKVEVEVYDRGNTAYQATLVIDKSRIDRFFAAKGDATGYLLIGMSRISNAMKNIKANTLSYGGVRVFNFTTWDDTDGSGGYWQHFHATWAGDQDYVIAPIHNPKLFGDSALDSGWMNKLNETTSKLERFNYLTIFPRVSYLIEQIFIENGYSIDTSAMDGTGWDELFLFSAATMSYWQVGFGLTPMSSIGISIKDFIDPELSAFDLVYQLCRKYGWVPIPDYGRDHITLVPLKSGDTGEVKDFTRYINPGVDNEFTQDGDRSFSFTNRFTGNDGAVGSNPDFDGFTIGVPVMSYDDLPDPTTGAYDRTVIFVYTENKWYQVVYDETLADRTWSLFSDNIYDEEEEDSTDTMDSEVTTLPIYKTKYRTDGGNDYYGWFPYCEQESWKPWGIRTFLYLGMYTEEELDGTPGPNQYPHLSCVRCKPDGTEVATFSNVFRHANPSSSNEDLGIIEHWFRNWLDIISSPEINEQKLSLPLHVLRKLRWDDQVLIFNIPYLVMSFLEPRPYNGYIQAKLKRINSAAVAAGGPGAAVYVKLYLEDEQAGADFSSPDPIYGGAYNYTNVVEHKVIARFFSDLACTTPVAVSGLSVIFHQLTKKDGVDLIESDMPIVCSGTEKNYAEFFGAVFTYKEYDVAYTGGNPSPLPDPGSYEFIFSIGASPDYTVVP